MNRGLEFLIDVIAAGEFVGERIPGLGHLLTDRIYDLAASQGRTALRNMINKNLPPEKIETIANSFFRNPELQNASYQTRQAYVRFMIESLTTTQKQRAAFLEKHKIPAPTHGVFSPTEACNKNCIGCYAEGHREGKAKSLSPSQFQDAIEQAREMGIRWKVITGGEPFIYKQLLEILSKYKDSLFLVYTNGSKLVDIDLCRELARMGNVFPAISIEGDRELTDGRRGQGTYDEVIKANENLTDAGVFHGFSTTSTSKNVGYILSKQFIEEMRKLHCGFGYYFTYIPVGEKADVSLMINATQRLMERAFVSWVREEYGLAVFGFWDDGDVVCDKEGHACLAAARQYFHIRPGGVDPCVFYPFTMPEHDIVYMRLENIITSPFFRAVRAAIPADPKAPCQVIDHPQIQRDIVRKYGAVSCDGSECMLTGKTADFLDKLSANWRAECNRDVRYNGKYFYEITKLKAA